MSAVPAAGPYPRAVDLDGQVEPEPAERVVVLRALGLGDLLTVVPALRGVRRAHPRARIVLAAPAGLRPLALHTGAVDDVVDTAPLAPLAPELAGADVAVNLHGRGPQSTALLADSRPGRLVAYGLPDAPRWNAEEHEVVRWCRLLLESGIPADPRDLLLAPPAVQPLTRAAVLVHPGAAQASRRWPVERWVSVVRAFAGAGHELRVTGGPDERDLATEVARRAGLTPEHVLAGRTDLLALCAAVAAARLLVSADTGVAHVATAFGTPSVVLFGPNPPSLWGPPRDRPQHRVLWAGRTGDNFAPAPDPGLLELTVEQVLDAAGVALSTAA